ncbi:protein kinase family protein [Xanthomonas arboricola]|uniref:ORC-CDC6 family AAA ATPase n=1 Tax=Xanthomonas arboricola TaxID=56448 RepID=UPI0011B0CE45|nr:protein kinase family protein [Xanthomonas arboricola]
MGGDTYKYGPEIDQLTIDWLSQGAVFPEILIVKINEADSRRYRILDRDGKGQVALLKNNGRRGKKGFVLKVQEVESERAFAAKLCIPEDYAGTSPLTEIEFGRALRSIERLVLIPYLVGRVDRFDDEPRKNDGSRWVCYLSDWLEGVTLQELVNESPEKITPSLAARVAKDLLTVVIYMESTGFKHDDLNLGNLMLEMPDASLASINPELAVPRLRVIDLGSMKNLSRATIKRDDDWSLTAKCLATIYNAIHRNRLVASQYSHFLRLFREFIYALSDDHSRNFPDKGDYFKSIDNAESAITIISHKAEFHPLEAISAEHLANDKILLELFVDHLPWISMAQAPGPCVLLGPRGCGKSMVFRYMAAKTHITSKESRAEYLDICKMFGVYVGCASDLANDLIWVGRKKKEELDAHLEQVMDYFNLVVARELMRALSTAAGAKHFASKLGISESAKRGVSQFIEEAVGVSVRGSYVSGMDQFQACADGLDRLRLNLSRNMRIGPSKSFGTGATFIRELCARIKSLMPAFCDYRITFLLDDYTGHRLTKEIQSILNEIVFYRGSTHTFKVSSEPYGFEPVTHFGSRIDATREYKEIDAGVNCLGMQAAERKKFVEELLDRRLKEAGYVGRSGTLIGKSEYSNDLKLAQAIRAHRKGKQLHYNGLDVLANSWSGDVSTVLHIVMNMFADAHVGRETNYRIPNSIQHESIVRVSKGLRSRVATFAPYGQEMNSILSAFGDLAARLLVDHKAKVRNDSDDINRKYRIEWTLSEGADIESELRKIDNTGNIYQLYKELVRRAVFHESSQSRGKEGAGRRTVRLQVRSSLLPSFGTSLQHKNHIKIDRVEDFGSFLKETKGWADGIVARYKVSGDLFGDVMGYEDDDEF